MWRTLLCMALVAPAGAVAAAPASINLLRERAVLDPNGVIRQVRQQLDSAGATLAPQRERALLWGMGTAAINNNDAAALAEATLRLDGLGQVGAGRRSIDRVALAASGFLRARHDIANGSGDGLSEALRAADLMLDHSDPALTAWARFQLCDAYALAERGRKALPLCRGAEAAYRALGDRYGVADAENDLGIVMSTLQRPAAAALMYQRSRRGFIAAGAPELAVMVGDNLAAEYLKLGRPREALPLSENSLRHELAAGRISDSLSSSTNIADAQAALGHPHRAYALMHEAAERARKAGMNGELSDMLVIESRLAQRLGQLPAALEEMREAYRLSQATVTPAMQRLEAQLEQRYAVREKELRIRTLEHDNRLASLELKAARAQAAQRAEAQRRSVLIGQVSTLAVFGLLLVAFLLALLLRSQRRHAAELRLQALIDPLTGIENRRAFIQRAQAVLAERPESSAPTPILFLIDLDHFKRINDSAGHVEGDRVLEEVAACLTAHAAGHGHVARIGGEEFAVLTQDSDGDGGMQLGERLRRAVAQLPQPPGLPQQQVTVSIGAARCAQVDCRDLADWMRAADRALYAAKAGGRNRVVVGAAAVAESATAET